MCKVLFTLVVGLRGLWTWLFHRYYSDLLSVEVGKESDNEWELVDKLTESMREIQITIVSLQQLLLFGIVNKTVE